MREAVAGAELRRHRDHVADQGQGLTLLHVLSPAADALAIGGAIEVVLYGTASFWLVRGVASTPPRIALGLVRAPLALFVDDLQWLDQPSVEGIVFAARRLQSEGIAMLLAARGSHPPAGRDQCHGQQHHADDGKLDQGGFFRGGDLG